MPKIEIWPLTKVLSAVVFALLASCPILPASFSSLNSPGFLGRTSVSMASHLASVRRPRGPAPVCGADGPEDTDPMPGEACTLVRPCKGSDALRGRFASAVHSCCCGADAATCWDVSADVISCVRW
ncbi:hypothetical protein [Ralstonia solanacearum]|uniref:hypothetical protein n=1 Tax=Ralstonia solanacearum TaxID=305 RepID=UPI0011D21BDC|nr:hypothetical protein [Ralstonia solanacearum]